MAWLGFPFALEIIAGRDYEEATALLFDESLLISQVRRIGVFAKLFKELEHGKIEARSRREILK